MEAVEQVLVALALAAACWAAYRLVTSGAKPEPPKLLTRLERRKRNRGR